MFSDIYWLCSRSLFVRTRGVSTTTTILGPSPHALKKLSVFADFSMLFRFPGHYHPSTGMTRVGCMPLFLTSGPVHMRVPDGIQHAQRH